VTRAVAKKETNRPLTQISVATAARILRISERGVLRLIERGEIEARVIGRSGAHSVYYTSVVNYAAKIARQEKPK
jgi:excisionase family DNA binding protein